MISGVMLILADSEVAWGKLVPIGIFVLIWVVGMVASGVKKASEQATKLRQRQFSQNSGARANPVRRLPKKPLWPGKPLRAKPPTSVSAQAWNNPVARQQIDRTAPSIVQQAQALAAMARTVPPLPTGRPPAATRGAAPPRQVATVSAIEARTIEAQRVSDARADTSSGGMVSASESDKSPRVNARALSVWLRPPTLRDQFILTEIFQPPLALRQGKSNVG